MATPKKLYIDDEGVQRGFYVYIHRERESGEVFYVGKGSGRRAWDTKGRHELWQERTKILDGAWDVDIVLDDLTEIEAFELEQKLVQEHGGPSTCGGMLANWFPGGEDPASVAIEVKLPSTLAKWMGAYDDAREFNDFPREHQEDIARQLVSDLKPFMEVLSNLQDEAEDTKDEELDDSVMELDCVLSSLLSETSDFLRRRQTWKNFALCLEEMLDDVEPTDISSLHKKVRPVARMARKRAEAVYSIIDSGNRQLAERIANEESRDQG